MRPILTAIVTLVLSAAAARALAGEERRPGEEPAALSPDERAGSSWRRMTGLALRRFRDRADALPMGSQRAHAMYRECIDDAWFLGEEEFVEGEKAPCARVLRNTEGTRTDAEPAPGDGGEGPPTAARGAQASARPANGKATLADFRRCAEGAWEFGRPSLLGGDCAAQLGRHSAGLPELDDDRLAAWLGRCKTALTGGEVSAAAVPAEERPAFERHCLRTLQILYDATGKQRLSDWWTPEEMQKLQKRKPGK